MSEQNWYETDNWYAPFALTEETAEEPQTVSPAPQKKKKRGWMWIAGCVLLFALIAASSLLFRKPQTQSQAQASVPSLPFVTEKPDDEMPADKDDFFSSFYEKVETQESHIGIERVGKLPSSFRLELKAPGAAELTLQELYSECADSIVAISGFKNGLAGYNWGTGVILSADGLILTNTHVIEDCDLASVTLYDNRELPAMLVGADSISDIAVLKIDASGLPAATFGESSRMQVGDRVAAIGNPLGETFRCTLTDGIISAIERGISYNGHSMTLLQTNTALNEGNSGGALFNMYGQVVGVTNMKMMSSYSSIEGIGFAIPSSTVKEVVNSIVRFGEVRGRPSIGITVGAIPENAKSQYDLPDGLYISEVADGSDAKAKGILPGDIITAVNGIPVTTTEEIGAIKNQLQVGDVMVFSIWRDGETLEIEVELVDTNDVYG